jgi:hypothetical protein
VAYKKIDKIRRNFPWCGKESASGAECMVNWKLVCSPKNCGGLAVKDLELVSKALHLRWLWLNWQDPERPWHGLPLPVGADDLPLFEGCTSVHIGNGIKAIFWKDSWLNGLSSQQRFLELFAMARRKNLSVSDAVINGRWMGGLQRLSSPQHIDQFVEM